MLQAHDAMSIGSIHAKPVGSIAGTSEGLTSHNGALLDAPTLQWPRLSPVFEPRTFHSLIISILSVKNCKNENWSGQKSGFKTASLNRDAKNLQERSHYQRFFETAKTLLICNCIKGSDVVTFL